jgi:hypothetical protein
MVPFVGDPVQFFLLKLAAMSVIVVLAMGARCVHFKGDHLVLTTVCGIAITPVIWNTAILWMHT